LRRNRCSVVQRGRHPSAASVQREPVGLQQKV
jgi:hypothetical protein